MANILETYYRGILQQIRGEVDFINSIFVHQGVKGDGNETILRDLLEKFIPKKYGVATGILIDRKGNQSKQIDIVIYDKMLYPSILSLSSVHLFPVDIVYAVVEVKTTLNSDQAKRAIENIASVRTLDIIPEQFTIGTSSSQGFQVTSYNPSPPLGIVFAYNSQVNSFEVFKEWFVTNANNYMQYPSVIGCLDQGLLFNDVLLGQPTRGSAIVFHHGEGKCATVKPDVASKELVHEGILYPIKTVAGQRILVDQSRVLLLFVVYLSELLEAKPINPAIKFSQHYFDEFTAFRIDV